MLIFILQFTATLPHICHHFKTPLNMAFDAGWWQSGSKNGKRFVIITKGSNSKSRLEGYHSFP